MYVYLIECFHVCFVLGLCVLIQALCSCGPHSDMLLRFLPLLFSYWFITLLVVPCWYIAPPPPSITPLFQEPHFLCESVTCSIYSLSKCELYFQTNNIYFCWAVCLRCSRLLKLYIGPSFTQSWLCRKRLPPMRKLCTLMIPYASSYGFNSQRYSFNLFARIFPHGTHPFNT